MRRLLLALALLLPTLALATCPTDPYSTVVCADSPTHYYPLDDHPPTGTTNDAIGSFNGTVSSANVHVTSTDGIVGAGTSAFAFHSDGGSGTYNINLGDHSAFWIPLTNNVGFSVELWSRQSATTFGAAAGTTGDTSYQWELDLNPTANSARVITYNCGASNNNTTGNVGSLALNSYHHLVFTTLGSGSSLQHLRLYVDGSLITTETSFGVTICSNGVNAPSQIFNRGDTSANQFTGDIDNVAYYNVELTSTQVSAHYTAGITAPIVDVHKNRPFTSKRDEWRERLLYPAALIERGAPSIEVDAPTFVLDRLNKRAIRSRGVYAP